MADRLPAGIHHIPDVDYQADPAPAPSLSSGIARALLARRSAVVYVGVEPEQVVDEMLEAELVENDPRPSEEVLRTAEERLMAEIKERDGV